MRKYLIILLFIPLSVFCQITTNEMGIIRNGGGIGDNTNSYNQNSSALFARMPVALSTNDKKHIDTLITSLVNKGYWQRLDDIWVTAVKDSANACIDWKRASNNLIPKKSITFQTYKGFTGHAEDSSYIETNFLPKTDGVYYKKKSASVITYCNTNIPEDHAFLIGTSNSPNSANNLATGNIIRTAQLQSKINDGQGTYLDILNIKGKFDGLFVNQRDDSLHSSMWFNGYLQTENDLCPVGNAFGDSAYHLLNNSFTHLNNSSNRIAFAAVGDTFTFDEQKDIQKIIYKYLSSVGGVYDNWSNDTVFKQGFEGTGFDNLMVISKTGAVNEDYTDTVLSGNQSCLLPATTSANATFPLHGDSSYLSFMWQVADATPAAESNIIYLGQSSTVSTRAILVRLTTGGKLKMYCGGGSINASGNTVLSDSTTYYFWVEFIKGTGTNAVAKLYVNTTNSKPTNAEVTITNGDAILPTKYILFYGSGSNTVIDNITVKRTQF